jgi:hypothetical protein
MTEIMTGEMSKIEKLVPLVPVQFSTSNLRKLVFFFSFLKKYALKK